MIVRCALAIAGTLLFCAQAQAQQRTVHTYADLEAEVARNTVRWQTSQLTSRPERSLDNSGLSFRLFFQLPLRERVHSIMDSFASTTLDGEYGERMHAMLDNRTEPRSWWETPDPRSAEDTAYTRAIFRTIDGFDKKRVRDFCITKESYERFRKKLEAVEKTLPLLEASLPKANGPCPLVTT